MTTPPINELFWGVLLLVALLAAVIVVRLVGKRRERSRGERAKTDAGLGRANLTATAPPRKDSHD